MGGGPVALVVAKSRYLAKVASRAGVHRLRALGGGDKNAGHHLATSSLAFKASVLVALHSRRQRWVDAVEKVVVHR
jgi:hypothetical protein